MEFFAWPLISTECYESDDVTSLWIPNTQSNTWQWSESSSASCIGLPQALPFGDSAINSPESFHSSESFPDSNYADSNFDASPPETSVDFEILSDVKIAGRPRAPVSNGRDPNENRIQRRRTQNRNSQRVYRQRRIEERNVFEARATAAEEISAKLTVEIKVLTLEVATLSEQIRKLEVKNANLCICNNSKDEQSEG